MNSHTENARRELQDPRIAPERLAQLAESQPELGALVAAHPRTPVAVITALLGSQDPLVRQAAARRRADDVAAITAQPTPRAQQARGATRIPPAPRLFTRPRVGPESAALTDTSPPEYSETVALERGMLPPAPRGEHGRHETPREDGPRSAIVIEGSEPLPLSETDYVLGRRPEPTGPAAAATKLAVHDATRTVSKTHARLHYAEGSWWLTDLGSTNGVLLDGAEGPDLALDPGVPAAVTGAFWLGDLRLRIEERPRG